MPPFDISSEQRKAVQLLARFKCRSCQKFKGHHSYSNKELNSYRNKKLYNPHTTEISALLRCRECAGNQVHELQCEGPCGMWKDLSQFSKNSRTRGMKWCIECTLWKEAQEPGIATTPAPNNELAPDEDENVSIAGDAGYYSDPEEGGYSDGEYEISHNYTGWGATTPSTPAYVGVPASHHTNVPLQGLANLKITAPNVPTGQNGVSDSSIPQMKEWVAPHKRGQGDDASSKTETASNNNYDIRSQSSASNPFERTKSEASVSESGWSAIDTRRRPDVQAFNAWGPQGQHQVQQHYPSSSEHTSTRSGGLPTPAISASRAPAPTTARRSAWAKPVGNRTGPAKAPAPKPIQTNRIDDSESDDEM